MTAATARAPASLQGRLLALVLSLVLAVWALTAMTIWLDVRGELDDLLDSHLQQAAELLLLQQTHEAAETNPGPEPQLLRPYAPDVAFQVFQDGHPTLRSSNAPAAPMVSLGSAAEPAAGFSDVTLAGQRWRLCVARGAERGVLVIVGEPLQARTAILRTTMRDALWPLLLALPVLALATWWAVRQGMGPLRRLGRKLDMRHPQALSPVVVEGAPAEMMPMLAALNGLFERIAALMASERRFTADAAHELRTPIAAIRTQAQVALGEADEPLRRHALVNTLAGCDRAARLIEQLLTLSRLESDALPAREPVDLAALLRQVAADLVPLALSRQQTLEVQAEGVRTVYGDATLLAVLLRNLLDNALRYSPPHARVLATLARSAAGLQLVVHDSGPGLAAADQARLGERFFRVLGNEASGSGLGFSIVRRIASVHGALLDVARSSELGGLKVTLTWPAG